MREVGPPLRAMRRPAILAICLKKFIYQTPTPNLIGSEVGSPLLRNSRARAPSRERLALAPKRKSTQPDPVHVGCALQAAGVGIGVGDPAAGAKAGPPH